MGVLVFAEHDNNTLKPATLNTVTAALALGAPTVLVAGSKCQPVAEAAARSPASRRFWWRTRLFSNIRWPRRRLR